MADLKISELTETTSVTTSNYAPVSAGAVTKRFALTNLRPGFTSRTINASDSLVANDIGNIVFVNSASAVTITIPTAGTIPSGSAPILVVRLGTGTVDFSTSGTMAPDPAEIAAQNGSMLVYCYAADTFWLSGDGLGQSPIV